jgi:hypothetical protein
MMSILNQKKLNLKKISRTIAIVLYCLIIVKGFIIYVPFILFLFGSLTEFETITQLTAIMAFVGLYLLANPIKTKSKYKDLLNDLLVFALLLTPIMNLLIVVPYLMYDFPEFSISAALFGIFYTVSLIIQLQTMHKEKL